VDVPELTISKISMAKLNPDHNDESSIFNLCRLWARLCSFLDSARSLLKSTWELETDKHSVTTLISAYGSILTTHLECYKSIHLTQVKNSVGMSC